MTAENFADAASRRRAGLKGWGIVLIVIGGLAALVTAGMLAVSVFNLESAMQTRQHQRQVPDADLFIGLMIVFAVAVGVIWTGIGSIRRRRWVRPIILIASTFVMAYGLLDIVAVLLRLPHAVEVASSPATGYVPRGGPLPQQSAVIAGFCVHAAAMFGIAIVLPWFLRRFFAQIETAAELADADPQPSWAERCPVSVLGWVVLCAFGGIGLLLRLQYPSVPAFTFMLNGMPAIVCLAGFGILLLWGAWLCYRLDRLGLILTSVFVTALHLSVISFLCNGGSPTELNQRPQAYRPTQIPNAQIRVLTESDNWVVTATAILEAIMVFSLEFIVARGFVTGWRISAVPGIFWAPINWQLEHLPAEQLEIKT